jgi:hypothetical protein
MRRYVISLDLDQVHTDDPIVTSEDAALSLSDEMWANPVLLETVTEYAVGCEGCDYLVAVTGKKVAHDIARMANQVGVGGHQHVLRTVSRVVSAWKEEE